MSTEIEGVFKKPTAFQEVLLDEAMCGYRIECLLERAKLHLIMLKNDGVDVSVSMGRIEEALTFYHRSFSWWTQTCLKFEFGLKLIQRASALRWQSRQLGMHLNGKGQIIDADLKMRLVQPNGAVIGERLANLRNEYDLCHYRARHAYRAVGA